MKRFDHFRADEAPAFTVLELLIGIVIIAVVLIFALTGMRALRESAGQSGCLRNLRTIGIANHAYAADHQGFLPRGDVPNSDGTRLLFWPAPLAPYLGMVYPDDINNAERMRKSPLYCPAEEVYASFTYVQNRELNERLYGEKAWIRLAELRYPSKYMLYADGYYDRTIFSDLRSKMISMSRMNRRHGGKPNFLYADGHAAPFTEELYGIADAQGKTPFYQMLWRARYP